MGEVFIRSRDAQRIVLRKATDGFDIPTMKIDKCSGPANVSLFVAETVLGADTMESIVYPFDVLYMGNYWEHSRGGLMPRNKEYWVLEAHEIQDFHTLPEFEWVNINDMKKLVKLNQRAPAVQNCYRRLLREAATGEVCPSIPPYGRSGFHSKFREWTKRVLQSRGLYCDDKVFQIYWSLSSSTFTLRTNQNVLIYCKIVNPKVPEAAITAHMYELFPDKVVEPIFVDVKHNVFLTWDFGDVLEDKLVGGDCETLLVERLTKEVAMTMGHIQLESVAFMDKMRQHYFWKDRGIKKFMDNYDAFINDAKARGFVSQVMFDTLTELSSSVHEICTSLLTFNVPLTVCHGDINLTNATSDVSGNVKIFDWHTASLSHPFFDLVKLETDDVDTIESYLLLFVRYEPLNRLWKVFSLVRVLYCGWAMSVDLELTTCAGTLDEVEDEELASGSMLRGFISDIHDYQAGKVPYKDKFEPG